MCDAAVWGGAFFSFFLEFSLFFLQFVWSCFFQSCCFFYVCFISCFFPHFFPFVLPFILLVWFSSYFFPFAFPSYSLFFISCLILFFLILSFFLPSQALSFYPSFLPSLSLFDLACWISFLVIFPLTFHVSFLPLIHLFIIPSVHSCFNLVIGLLFSFQFFFLLSLHPFSSSFVLPLHFVLPCFHSLVSHSSFPPSCLGLHDVGKKIELWFFFLVFFFWFGLIIFLKKAPGLLWCFCRAA